MSRADAGPRETQLIKMHGAHNSFVIFDDRDGGRDAYGELGVRLCDAAGEFGGADGLLVVAPARDALARMRVINADGSEAEMCGNGVRCVARYLAERGAPDRFRIATLAGPIEIEVLTREPAWSIRADVGPVRFPSDAATETIEAAGASWTYVSVSLGNPHVVISVDDVAAIDVERIGREIATSERFPHGTNVHFMQRLDDRTVRVRHYERGVGVTAACGTGIVASAATAVVRSNAIAPVTVHVPGGTVVVNWALGETAQMTGPAEFEFARTVAL